MKMKDGSDTKLSKVRRIPGFSKGITEMKQKVLVVVDMQNDFIDGALGSKEAAAIVPAVCDRIRKMDAEGALIFATMDTHSQNYMETREGRFLPAAWGRLLRVHRSRAAV